MLAKMHIVLFSIVVISDLIHTNTAFFVLSQQQPVAVSGFVMLNVLVINCFNYHSFSCCVFLLQTVKQEKTWCVRSESTELLRGLLAWVRAQWEAMFGVKLHTSLQDKVA